jgi:endonuclease/exonuclease/phosphatase family metal-dependent hydrolase
MAAGYRGLHWLRLGVAAVLTFVIAMPGLSEARDKRELVVMTQNLYLGSSLDPVLEATNAEEFLIGVATIYGTVQFTDFPSRAELIADSIAVKKPDIIGLQEVAKWTAVDSVLGVTEIEDFLEILVDELAQRGLSYSVVGISHNVSLGPIPLVAPCSVNIVGACVVWYQDRDVILVGDNPALKILASQSGRYNAQESILSPLGPISFDRGWVYVDGKFQNKKFRLVNTHLEVESYPQTQQAQAREFLAGPAKAPGAVIAVGDFNSAADGSTTQTYAMLTKSYFDDAWDTNPGDPGYTCCQDGFLANFDSMLNQRIDLILTHAASRALDAERVNDQPYLGMSPPFWPSDHAGVVSTIRIH